MKHDKAAQRIVAEFFFLHKRQHRAGIISLVKIAGRHADRHGRDLWNDFGNGSILEQKKRRRRRVVNPCDAFVCYSSRGGTRTPDLTIMSS